MSARNKHPSLLLRSIEAEEKKSFVALNPSFYFIKLFTAVIDYSVLDIFHSVGLYVTNVRHE
jgi:hypothetical protein